MYELQTHFCRTLPYGTGKLFLVYFKWIALSSIGISTVSYLVAVMPATQLTIQHQMRLSNSYKEYTKS